MAAVMALVDVRTNTLAFPCLRTANLVAGGTWTGHDAANRLDSPEQTQ
jgi:hypothetical protein